MEILGIDIGGSGIKGAPVDMKTGELTADRLRIETPLPATPAAIADCVAEIAKHFEWSGKIGCGFPAAIKNGIVKTATNIDKSWIGTDAVQLFSKATRRKAAVINDADAAGMAEIRLGAGRNVQGTVLMITVGTGIGTALFYNGTLLPNTELGHLKLGKKTAEAYASGATREKLNLDWKQWADRFNEYLQYAEFLLWPDLIIIGGGLSKKSDKFLQLLYTKTKVVPAFYMNNAGIIGAAIAGEEN
ncbi:MAG: ROK family protein [Bacteroidia bacterium]|nr:ROK family protein [Bacteroidia bacterium]